MEQTKSSAEAQCKELVETIFAEKAQVQLDQDGVARYVSMAIVRGTM